MIELGGKINGIFRRNYFLPEDASFIDKKEEFIRRCQNTDVYQTIYSYKTKEPDTAEVIAPLYFDLDYNKIEKDYDTIRKYTLLLIALLKDELKLSEDDIRIYFSGHKGFHVLIDETILAVPALVRLNEIYKSWAVYFSKEVLLLDTKIYDKRRLFRIPNTINSATGLYKVPVPLSFLCDTTYEKMREYASAPKFIFEPKRPLRKKSAVIFLRKAETFLTTRKRKTAPEYNIEKKELLPCVKTLLQGGITEGSRNQSASLLTNALFQAGYSNEEVESIIIEWNATNDPPLTESELMATTRSSRNMVSSGVKYGCQSFRDLGLCSGCEIGGK